MANIYVDLFQGVYVCVPLGVGLLPNEGLCSAEKLTRPFSKEIYLFTKIFTSAATNTIYALTSIVSMGV